MQVLGAERRLDAPCVRQPWPEAEGPENDSTAAFVAIRNDASSGSAGGIHMRLRMRTRCLGFLMILGTLFLFSCGLLSTSYNVTKGTVKTSYKLTKGLVKGTLTTGKLVYNLGEFTFEVIMAPLSWPLTHQEIESVDGLPPKQAIQKGRVKRSPYVVKGKRYVPMSTEAARNYREKGTASWYGYETYRKKGGRMTANGEAFNPEGLSAAHKLLPLPAHVRVTNLENRRSVVVRVNDRGPFVRGRIIDVSAGAAKRLGFYRKGTARVLVETIEITG